MRAVLCLIACLAAGCSRPRSEADPPRQSQPDGPVVRVTASYPGANATEVANVVAVPMEQQLNGAEGLLLIESECRNFGTYTATLTFAAKTDARQALEQVRKRLALAAPTLPAGVQQPVVTARVHDADRFPRMWVALTSPDKTMNAVVLAKAADALKLTLARVPGVSDIYQFGPTGSALRVWLDPKRLEARALTVQDVAEALSAQDGRVTIGRTVQVAPRLRSNDLPALLITGENDEQKLGDVLIKEVAGGKMYVKDVGRVESAVRSDSLAQFGDRPAALVAVVTADDKALHAAVNAATKELNKYEMALAGEVIPDVTGGNWSLVELRLPDGITPARVEKHATDVLKRVRAMSESPKCFALTDEEQHLLRVVAKIPAKDTGHIRTAMAGFADVRTRVSDLAGGEPFPVRIALTDEGGHGIDKLREWAEEVARRLAKEGIAIDPDVYPGPGGPIINVRIDRKKAAELGVTVREIIDTLETALGDLKEFNGFGGLAHDFDLLAAMAEKRHDPSSLKKLLVTTSEGKSVSLGSVVEFTTMEAPPAILRVNLHPALRITAAVPEGKTVAEVAAKCAEIAEAERKALKMPEAFKMVNLSDAKPR